MTLLYTRPAGLRRRGRLLAVSLLAAIATLVTTASLAVAAPAPTATAITIARVSTPSITVPSTPGAAAPYVVRAVPFTVDLTTDQPLSTTKATRVRLSVTSGPDAGRTAFVDVPAGATSASVTGVVLSTAFNGVGLEAAVDARKTSVAPGTTVIDVLRTSLSAPAGSKVTGFGGGGGPGVRCSPTASDPVCGDLLLPESAGVLSDQLLSQGACNGLCNSLGSFLQVLVSVDPAVYNNRNPIEVVAKCDKSLCSGGGIKSYSVSVQLTPASPPVPSPPCSAKGVVDAGRSFCTDYVQSTRDNAGDLLLSVLLAQDAKIIFK